MRTYEQAPAGASRHADAYDEWYMSRADPDDPPTPTAPWHELAKRHLGDIRGLRVLEIGCGPGVFAAYLADRGADVVAADISPFAVEWARETTGGRCETLVADMEKLPFSDEAFDLVVSLETLEHVPDADRGIAELVRVTTSGGRLLVNIPNHLNFLGLYRIGLHLAGRAYTELGQPVNHPLTSLWEMRRLRRLGCRIDAVDGTFHPLPLPRVGTLELRLLERAPAVTKWFAYHLLVGATRLG